VRDLEKWLVLLLNKFYDGNPNSLKNIDHVTIILTVELFNLGSDED
jgi:hypothetical protein